jgi:hypothetical protein
MVTGQVYLESSDEYEELCETVEYEVDDVRLLDVATDCICRYYFDTISDNNVTFGIYRFIKDAGILDDIVDWYYEDIKETFKEEAIQQWLIT